MMCSCLQASIEVENQARRLCRVKIPFEPAFTLSPFECLTKPIPIAFSSKLFFSSLCLCVFWILNLVLLTLGPKHLKKSCRIYLESLGRKPKGAVSISYKSECDV